MPKLSYALSIKFSDTHTNEFLELGGAAWTTRREQMQHWDSIPVTSGETCILLDLESPNGDIEDTHCIDAKTASALLGAPLGVLIHSARERLAAVRQIYSCPVESYEF